MTRIRLVFFLFTAVFAVIILRLFYWQVIVADKLAISASLQYQRITEIPALRGEIRMADGMMLAVNETSYEMTINKKENKDDPKVVAELLAPLFTLSQPDASATLSGLLKPQTEEEVKDLILTKLSINADWVILFHKIPSEIKTQIESLKIKGIYFAPEQKRFYPESSMSASLLGFVGSDYNGYDKGYFGLEGFYDRELKGNSGVVKDEQDVLGRPILIGDRSIKKEQNGRSLILSVDRTAQYIVEMKLKEGIQKYGAKSGTVTVMNPKTGNIIAMATSPSYDPGSWYTYDPVLYKNPVVAGSFEPGSIFKVLVMSAGLDTGVITPDTRCSICAGPVELAGYFIRTWNNKYYENTTMTDVLAHSDNTGMVFISQLLKRDRFLKYLRNFGIGQMTGIDLEEETTVELRADKDWRSIDLATASFGQGIAVTPIQMVRAVGAIANNGILMEPHLVSEVIQSDGKVINIKPKQTRRVISMKTAKVMTEMMINAVDQGEAKWAKPKGYRIAGKTGTAQIPVAGHYDDKRTIASFVGFAPADNPKIVMLVTLTEPTTSQWGSETAAPLFFSIIKELFSYYSIGPE